MKTVLITGAAGVIGSRLIDANMAAGFKVEALVLPGDPGIKRLRDMGVDVLIGDITEYHEVEHAAGGVDTLFHAAVQSRAGKNPQSYRQVNVKGMENLCRAALRKNVKRLVIISSQDLFGFKGDGLIDEKQDYRYWGEALPDSLIDAAQIAWQYHKKGLPVTMAYAGPGNFLHSIVESVIKGNSLFFRKDSLFFPTYIRNLIHLLMVLAENPKAVGEGFLVHENPCGSLQDFLAKLTDKIGVASPSPGLPYLPAWALAGLREKIARLRGKDCVPLKTAYAVKKLSSRLQYSLTKAEQLLGWKAPVSQEEGLQIMLNQFMEQ